MNNKDFVERLSAKAELDKEQVTELLCSFSDVFTSSLCDGKVISIQGFGNFEQKEKSERKIYNPSTKEFKLVPKKVVVNYKMSPVLKDRVNNP